MDIDKTLDQLESDLAGLLSETPPVELREFASKRDFLAYAKEQITLAKSDEAEVRKARLQHLLVNTELAKNGFQDTGAKSLPVFSGPLSVQAQTAWKERSEKETTPAAAAASGNPGPKGFAQKDGKVLTVEALLAAFDAMLATDGEEEQAAKGEEAADESATQAADENAETAEGDAEGDAAGDGDTEDTKKSDPWGTGLDMNFQKSEDPDEFDAGGVRAF